MALCTKRVYHSVESLFSYRDARETLSRFKFDGDRFATSEVAAHLVDLAIAIAADAYEWSGADAVDLAFVPSSPLRWFRHGFDHMFRLKRAVRRVLRRRRTRHIIGMTSPIARRWSIAPPQSRLDRTSRAIASKNAFRVRGGDTVDIGRRRACVIVIDDVTTTGSTLATVIDLLKAAGVRASAMTYAAQPRSFKVSRSRFPTAPYMIDSVARRRG